MIPYTKKCFFASLIMLATILSATSCDKIENASRSVSVQVKHPPNVTYQVGIGLNSPESLASWDTSGDVSLSFDATVGDAIYYNMHSQAQMSGIKINIESSDKLNLTLEGQIPNIATGYVIVD